MSVFIEFYVPLPLSIELHIMVYLKYLGDRFPLITLTAR